jgi:hypothetical protein
VKIHFLAYRSRNRDQGAGHCRQARRAEFPPWVVDGDFLAIQGGHDYRGNAVLGHADLIEYVVGCD